MNAKKIITLLLALLLVGSMAACSNKPAENQGNNSEPQTMEEARALYDQLMARENAILAENTELWDKVFLSADKGMATTEDGSNYGDFLLKTIENAKDKFDKKELALLTEGATEIKGLEDKMAALEKKFPGLLDAPSGGMSVPAENVPSDAVVPAARLPQPENAARCRLRRAGAGRQHRLPRHRRDHHLRAVPHPYKPQVAVPCGRTAVYVRAHRPAGLCAGLVL